MFIFLATSQTSKTLLYQILGDEEIFVNVLSRVADKFIR